MLSSIQPNFSVKTRQNQQKPKLGFGAVVQEGLLKGVKPDEFKSTLKEAIRSDVGLATDKALIKAADRLHGMLSEAMEALQGSKDTVGISLTKATNGGGHSLTLSYKKPNNRLVRIDSDALVPNKDPRKLENETFGELEETLKGYVRRATLRENRIQVS